MKLDSNIIEIKFSRLIDCWIIDCLTDRWLSMNWLIDWLIDWLFDCLIRSPGPPPPTDPSHLAPAQVTDLISNILLRIQIFTFFNIFF